MGSKASDNPHFGDGASPGKIFIGGLAKDTTLDTFVRYFGKYGEITDSVVMKDRHTGRPRGFGFITYAEPSVVDTVIAETHVINGKQVEIKRTIPKGSAESKDFKTKKIFVGGIPTSVTEDELKSFFSKYGKVVEHEIIRDHATSRSRGFGFIVFDSEQEVDNMVANGNMIDMAGTQIKEPALQLWMRDLRLPNLVLEERMWLPDGVQPAVLHHPVVLGNEIHWLLTNNCVLTFNAADGEIFTTFSPPKSCGGDFYQYKRLVEFKGRLGLCEQLAKGGLRVWVLADCKKKMWDDGRILNLDGALTREEPLASFATLYNADIAVLNSYKSTLFYNFQSHTFQVVKLHHLSSHIFPFRSDMESVDLKGAQ
ncbi:uncharacterized protein LOC132308698 isoform X1 [Cornus florida]|uniref:uncharacterized protein LOC132308698 isoform X1 n=1 Tax=Cornus florida TaxID=4283 RepID=UPI00289D27FB|nr:uncharacterized protein LOC132308698 isoform X1 [Cornus florida]